MQCNSSPGRLCELKLVWTIWSFSVGSPVCRPPHSLHGLPYPFPCANPFRARMVKGLTYKGLTLCPPLSGRASPSGCPRLVLTFDCSWFIASFFLVKSHYEHTFGVIVSWIDVAAKKEKCYHLGTILWKHPCAQVHGALELGFWTHSCLGND